MNQLPRLVASLEDQGTLLRSYPRLRETSFATAMRSLFHLEIKINNERRTLVGLKGLSMSWTQMTQRIQSMTRRVRKKLVNQESLRSPWKVYQVTWNVHEGFAMRDKNSERHFWKFSIKNGFRKGDSRDMRIGIHKDICNVRDRWWGHLQQARTPPGM